VVDDDPDMAQLLMRILREAGYGVEAYANAASARRGVLEAPPDCVLIDIILPDGDGLVLLRELKADARLAFVPMLIVTIREEIESRVLGLDAGADDYLVKPIHEVVLLSRIRSLLRMKRQHDELVAERNRLRAAHAELREANRFRDEAVQALFHDVRSPLVNFEAWCETLAERPALPAEIRSDLRDQLLAMVRVRAMADELMELALAEAGQMTLRRETVHLGALLRDAVGAHAELARSRDIGVSVDVAATPRPQVCDENKIYRAVANLVSNAIKHHVPPGRPQARNIWLCARERAVGVQTQVEIEVRDDGPGIPQEELPFVFERFRRGVHRSAGQVGSVGLGLSLVRQIAELHGGGVRVKSRVGEGSTFVLWFPSDGGAMAAAGGATA